MNILILFVLLLISIFIIFIFISEKKKEENRRRIEEENKRIENEKKRQEDLKFDKIINCPICKGHGNCIIEESYRFDTDHETGIAFKIVGKIRPDWYSEDSKRHYEYHEKKCPYCNGKGIAFAYFETYSYTCGDCKGEGKIKYIERVKLEIGRSEEQKAKICGSCNGTGITESKGITIKSILSENELDPKFHLKYRYGEKIDEYNREFFSKSKDRNFQTNL